MLVFISICLSLRGGRVASASGGPPLRPSFYLPSVPIACMHHNPPPAPLSLTHTFNQVGSEGTRAPGNIPRAYGMLNSEVKRFGANLPDGDDQAFGDTKSPPRSQIHGWESPVKESALAQIAKPVHLYGNSNTKPWSRCMEPGHSPPAVPIGDGYMW